MSYGEAWRLIGVLATDPANQVSAALAGWDFAASRESLVLMDLYDMQLASKSRRAQRPYPRPFADGVRRRFGRSKFSPSRTREILAARGPSG